MNKKPCTNGQGPLVYGGSGGIVGAWPTLGLADGSMGSAGGDPPRR
jgi:hypothetical protein